MILDNKEKSFVNLILVILLVVNTATMFSFLRLRSKSIILREEYIKTSTERNEIYNCLFKNYEIPTCLDLLANTFIDKNPVLVLAYDDYCCISCLLSEFENLKQISEASNTNNIVIVPFTDDKAKSIELLRVHEMMNFRILFPKDSIPYPKNNSGFILYFTYFPDNLRPTNIFYPSATLESLTYDYFDLVLKRLKE